MLVNNRRVFRAVRSAGGQRRTWQAVQFSQECAPMLNPERSCWNPAFAQTSPLFEPLRAWAPAFAQCTQGWPDLAVYQQLLEAQSEPVLTRGGQALKIVAQDSRPQRFEEHYAPRVYMTGELQTRRENWHDFFQFLSWLMFPKAKAVINALHVPHAEARISAASDIGRRSPVENMLSLFDEGGAVIISSDASLLQLIREFRWKELFWERRADLARNLRCISFGHALYEKALLPYIGMTANTILLDVDQAIVDQPMSALLPALDVQLAALFEAGVAYTQPQDLQPFPILGMPSWDATNSCAEYYDNTRYFRPGRGQARREPD